MSEFGNAYSQCGVEIFIRYTDKYITDLWEVGFYGSTQNANQTVNITRSLKKGLYYDQT